MFIIISCFFQRHPRMESQLVNGHRDPIVMNPKVRKKECCWRWKSDWIDVRRQERGRERETGNWRIGQWIAAQFIGHKRDTELVFLAMISRQWLWVGRLPKLSICWKALDFKILPEPNRTEGNLFGGLQRWIESHWCWFLLFYFFFFAVAVVVVASFGCRRHATDTAFKQNNTYRWTEFIWIIFSFLFRVPSSQTRSWLRAQRRATGIVHVNRNAQKGTNSLFGLLNNFRGICMRFVSGCDGLRWRLVRFW